ncbi:MAG: tetratricopeptide repeat protein [Paludibacteraceae bacterium]|nr:tetratricopeptide repeat protein [Paludibacteraceae bacterium]
MKKILWIWVVLVLVLGSCRRSPMADSSQRVSSDSLLAQATPVPYPEVPWLARLTGFFGSTKQAERFAQWAFTAYNDSLYTLAVYYCDCALACNYRFWPAYHIRGFVHYMQCDYEAAADDYEHVLRLNKHRDYFLLEGGDTLTCLDCAVCLAYSYCSLARYTDAVEFVKSQFTYFPGDYQLIESLSWAYTMLGNFPLAGKWANKIVDRDPFYAHFLLGYNAEQQGRLGIAIQNYLKALEINPESASIMYNLANVYWAHDEKEESLAWRLKAARLGDPNSQAWLRSQSMDW